MERQEAGGIYFMIYLDPETCWHVRQAFRPTPAPASIAPLRGVQHPRAPKVLDFMRQQAGGPVNMWRVVNALTKAEAKDGDDRGQRRFRRLCFWVAIRELLRVKLLFRHYDQIATANFGYRPRRKSVRNAHQHARRLASEMPGSNQAEAKLEVAGKPTQPIEIKPVTMKTTTQANPSITENAKPSLEQISCAASLIAMKDRPRPRSRRNCRKCAGYLGGERIRRMSLFRVPTDEILPVCLIHRGWVYVMREPESPRLFIERFKTSEVQRIKNPAAVLLGRLKAGRKERPSLAKAAAARRNGAQPCRPGSRPRGRPRRTGGAGGPTRVV